MSDLGHIRASKNQVRTIMDDLFTMTICDHKYVPVVKRYFYESGCQGAVFTAECVKCKYRPNDK